MSWTSLPKSLQEVRFVYELDPKLHGEAEAAEKAIRKLDFVISADWAAWQSPLMDVKCKVIQGIELSAIRWYDECVRKCIERSGARIIE